MLASLVGALLGGGEGGREVVLGVSVCIPGCGSVGGLHSDKLTQRERTVRHGVTPSLTVSGWCQPPCPPSTASPP